MSTGSELIAAQTGAHTEPTVVFEPEARMEVREGVAAIELNRPSRGNALSAPMVEALIGCVHQACADATVHTLAFGGAGRHFCTGFDISDIDAASEGDLLLRLIRIEALLDAVWRAPIRTVAVATGRAWGAGADLFAACDLRIATVGASFRFPGAAFGVVLGTRRLAERVGTERARTWVGTGMTLDAVSAAAAGLASRVIPASSPDEVLDWRAEAAVDAPLALDRETLAAIRAASRPAGGPGGDALADADLAALVRAASRPGLKARILAYRARSRAAARGPA